jgi:hypothetical protein
MQTIAVILLFTLSVAWLIRLLYRQFTTKRTCDNGCGKCGAVDFEAIEKQIRTNRKATL